MSFKVKDIVGAIESVAPRSLQESWDNTGLVVGDLESDVDGVLLCVDVTADIVDEAVERGCGMIVSHHPLIFRGVKNLSDPTRVNAALISAVRQGVAIYCCHTSIDKAVERGVSWEIGRMLGMPSMEVLAGEADGTGLGVIGEFDEPVAIDDLVARVKKVAETPVVRATSILPLYVKRLALCGGSGGEFIPTAHALGADAYLTSDVRYHDFCDYNGVIGVLDIGHFESENCTKRIFYNVISEKFANFAVYYSETEINPISYL